MKMLEEKIRDFNELYRRFKWRLPSSFNIGHDVCDKHERLSGDTALYYEDAKGNKKRFTFGQIKTASNRLGNALKALGVSREDRVGIILPQRPETAISHVAVYKIGAVALPLSILFGPDALRYRLGDSETKMVITDGARLPLIRQINPELPSLTHIIVCDGAHGELDFWQLLQKGSDRLDVVPTSSEDPALLIYTSGTTGPPKGALHAHRCLLGHLTGFEMSHNFFPKEGDLFWTPADWAWAGGLLDVLLPSWHYGVPVLAYEGGKFDPEKACRLVAHYGVKNAFIPPTAMKMLMQVKNIESRFSLSFRSIMSAGESVGEEIILWAKEKLGIVVNEMWGQTEVNYLVGNCSEIMDVKPGSIGKPYPGHVIQIMNDQGEPAGTEEAGELAVKRGDPVMFLGYWRQPDATQEKFLGDWFRTGDIAYRDPHGYHWFVGRKDDVISSAGYRIGPGEIEDCLLKHPAVAQAAAVGSPDPIRGTVVKAFIVLAEGYEPSASLEEDIKQHVKTRLAAYEYPREVEFLNELPMTTTGKIKRAELRRREIERKKMGGR